MTDLFEQSGIEPEQPLGGLSPVRAGEYPPSPVVAQLPGESRINDQPLDGCGETIGVPIVHQDAGVAVDDCLGNPSRCGGDDRPSRCGCLEVDQSLSRACIDLAARGVPHPELSALLADVTEAAAGGEPSLGDREPYFIPNDLSLCTEVSVLNCSHVDGELDLPAGFSIEAAATRPHAFAKPYYIDPIGGVRRAKGLAALESYADRETWDYDLSFVGHEGKQNPNPEQGLLADSSNLRYVFLESLATDYAPFSNSRIRLHRNRRFFFSEPNQSSEERERANQQTGYLRSIRDSRFVLCPRGGGPHSIRFYETLACANIPVFVGDRAAKFPLEWIIDWSTACFRISAEEVADGSYRDRLDEILSSPLTEVNRRRAYIFRIYHQFLAPERKDVFEQLVLLRVRELIRDRLGQAAPSVR